LKNAPTCFGSRGIHRQGAFFTVHVNVHDRTITVILAKHCIKLPDDGSLVI